MCLTSTKHQASSCIFLPDEDIFQPTGFVRHCCDKFIRVLLYQL